MAKNLLNKYVWLVETIYKAKKISFEEINSRWLDNDMSEKKPLSLRMRKVDYTVTISRMQTN